ncbi:bifunctional DNA primase/polymerase [Amycolatopsis sp. NPDC051106]|uniref:bifunctional DNA primase/polymerase n=1 Tax=unclassified Amycolatopsis TaxID=2618356 RepID=UPI003418EAF2
MTYREHAPAYLAAGWEPIPLPAKKKDPPPPGFGGEKAKRVTEKHVSAWCSSKGSGNIALALRSGVIGVDVDCYDGKPGAETLAAHEERWGKLPPTWTATSRKDGSGIRLFRCPPDLRGPGVLPGGGVELIQRHHRYVVVSPSVHPEGRQYRWISPDGRRTDDMPTPAELPKLPRRWVRGLRVLGVPAADKADPSKGHRLLEELPGGTPDAAVSARLARAVSELGDGSRHDTTRDHVGVLVRLGAGGAAGVPAAVAALRDVFVARVQRPRAGAEFDRMVKGAARIAAADAWPLADGQQWGKTLAGWAVGEMGDEERGDDRADVLQRRTDHYKLNLQAHQRARAELAAAEWSPPVSLGSLADQFAVEDEPVAHFVEDLAHVDSNVLLIAQWKAGKTTLGFNLAKASVDGVKFLDRYAVHLPDGPDALRPATVAYFNFEVSQRMAKKWLRDMEIEHPEHIHVEHLQGVPLPLTSRTVEEWTVEYLRSRNVSVWMLDPLGAAYEGEENSNTEMREWLKTVDRIKKRAGVSVAVVMVHTGATHEEGFRARGATRQMDWLDVQWAYRHGGDGVEIPPDSKRYLRAFGREIDTHGEISLDFDPLRRWMHVDHEGLTRHESKTAGVARKAWHVMFEHDRKEPGGYLNAGDLKARMGMETKGRAGQSVAAGIEHAVREGWIRRDMEGRTKRHYLGEENPDTRRLSLE